MKRRDSITFKGKAAHEAFLGFSSVLKIEPAKHTPLESKSASYYMHKVLSKERRKGCKIMHVWKEQEEADLTTLDPV